MEEEQVQVSPSLVVLVVLVCPVVVSLTVVLSVVWVVVLSVLAPTFLESSPRVPVHHAVASIAVLVCVVAVVCRLPVARQPILFRAAVSGGVGLWLPSPSKCALALVSKCKKASQASRKGRLGALPCRCLRAVQ